MVKLRINQSGQAAILVVVAVLLVFMIMIPMLVSLVQNEARWTVKQKKTTTAFHLAEAGVDRGVWKLRESDFTWEQILEGTKIEGYRGLTSESYTETVNGASVGEYVIDISSTALPNEVQITAKGQDKDQREVRTIVAVYSRNAVNASLDIDGTIDYKPNLTVHWGPVVTYSSIEMAPSTYYPRKISKGRIVGRDVDTSPPNTDGLEYWAYEDLGNPPQVDLDYYRMLAMNSRMTAPRKGSGTGSAVAYPAGSGYFRAADNPNGIEFRAASGSGNYEYESSTSVIYIEGNASLPSGKCWLDVDALVVTQDCDFNADFKTYIATIPVGAQNEYLHPSAQSMWTSEFAAAGEGGQYSISNCGMRGFLYVGRNFSNAGANAKIVGVIKVLGAVTINTMTVYYDAGVSSEVRLTSTPMRLRSWSEIQSSWE
ncbi:MAG: hypothetical protein WC955_05690 [Elusimicrobiota bacterium]